MVLTLEYLRSWYATILILKGDSYLLLSIINQNIIYIFFLQMTPLKEGISNVNEMSKTLNELNQKLEKEINDAFDELVKMMNDRRNELVSLKSLQNNKYLK